MNIDAQIAGMQRIKTDLRKEMRRHDREENADAADDCCKDVNTLIAAIATLKKVKAWRQASGDLLGQLRE